MRYATKEHKLADEAAVDRFREKFLRVTTSCDALREETLTPSQHYAALIERLSQEIDETVLPRMFALFSDAGMEAIFGVSNRRLIELEIGGKTVKFDTEADTDADTVARVCAKALRTLSLRSGPLRVRQIGRRAPKFATKGATCAARHLLEYSKPSNLQNGLKAFLKATHSQSLGWIFHSGDGQIVTHDPDEKIMENLHKLHQTVVSQCDDRGSFRRVERAVPTCSAFAMAADAQVLIAENGNDRLLSVFPTSELITAMTQWHEVFKRAGL